ncbi:hypothetical protein [Caldisphaera sp.]|uniref:hypothetical protein n=1 Tax=Caldisphaera sp. TaxID=2060322 RepID=UPI003D12AFF8
MLYSRALALIVIFSFLILGSLMFSLYGIYNKLDQGIIIKTTLNLIYYTPKNNKQISILSNNSQTYIIINNKEYMINHLDTNEACSYENYYIALSGYYNENPSLTIFYNNGSYVVYQLDESPTALYCTKNEIAFSGISQINPYIGFLNVSNGILKSYKANIYIGTPSYIEFYNNTYFITFNNNNVLLFNINKSYVISYPTFISLYGIFYYNKNIYLVGSINNNSVYGLLSDPINNNSFIVGLNDYQGYISIGVNKLNGFSLLYRPYTTWAYLITITQNKFVHTAMIGLSYPFSLYNLGTYDKGIWLTGSFTINNQSYQLGLYVNGSINGYIGYKLPVAYTLTSSPIVSSGFLKKVNVNLELNEINVTQNEIEYNKIYGISNITNNIEFQYLEFYVNKYIIFGEYTFISVIIGIIIYCILAKSYKWKCF